MPSLYSRPPNPQNVSKARAYNLRTSFKNMRETAHSVSCFSLKRAKIFLRNVLRHREAVVFTRYKAGVGGCPQTKNHPFGRGRGRWPAKSARFLLALLNNAESNARIKGLNTKRMEILHISVRQAPKICRRIYRAHGRINPFMTHPCHVEVILVEKSKPVRDPPQKIKKTIRKPSDQHAVSRSSEVTTSS
ncbi:uncharacterized protein LOC126329929 [Schistocerca gregaria]|uniref:uncharacterized protein LOC126329929 n=1 Tax=Schistocerca gregaria TaxID=7010 RepID=UPI00211F1969|nr:uncharacterized protein LOC126329929 [Schistocerca gregaria]